VSAYEEKKAFDAWFASFSDEAWEDVNPEQAFRAGYRVAVAQEAAPRTTPMPDRVGATVKIDHLRDATAAKVPDLEVQVHDLTVRLDRVEKERDALLEDINNEHDKVIAATKRADALSTAASVSADYNEELGTRLGDLERRVLAAESERDTLNREVRNWKDASGCANPKEDYDRFVDVQAERDALKEEAKELRALEDSWKTQAEEQHEAVKAAETTLAQAREIAWDLACEVRPVAERNREPDQESAARAFDLTLRLADVLGSEKSDVEIPEDERVAGAVCLECGDLRQPDGTFHMDEDGCCAACGRDAKLLYADGDVHFPEEEEPTTEIGTVATEPTARCPTCGGLWNEPSPQCPVFGLHSKLKMKDPTRLPGKVAISDALLRRLSPAAKDEVMSELVKATRVAKETPREGAICAKCDEDPCVTPGTCECPIGPSSGSLIKATKIAHSTRRPDKCGKPIAGLPSTVCGDVLGHEPDEFCGFEPITSDADLAARGDAMVAAIAAELDHEEIAKSGNVTFQQKWEGIYAERNEARRAGLCGMIYSDGTICREPKDHWRGKTEGK
jgi:outer membrane murein-binding lipoprotein Lpp